MKKKLTFTHFLAKRLIPWSIALTVVAIMMNLIMYTVMLLVNMQDFERESLIARSNITEVVAKGYDTPEKISYYLAEQVKYNDQIYSSAYAYADENYNVVATSEWNAFLIHHREKNAIDIDAVTDVYKCGSEEFLELLEGFIASDSGYLIEINEAYVKDGLFIPGTFTIFESDYETVVETKDFTPENKEEYLYIPRDQFYWRDVGTRDKEILKKAVSSAECGYINDKYTLSGYSLIDTPEMNYRLYFMYDYNFWAEMGPYMMANVAYMILTAVMISFITAFFAHNKYSKQYEIDEYRRNMTNALAHDLKTPLTAIYGYAENLKNNVHTEKKDYYAEAVLENVEYMNSIITSTLELAKTEEGSSGKPESINLAALSEQLFEKYRPAAEEKGIEFTVKGKSTVKADKTMLSRAIENLISNAVKYTVENGKIEVTADDKSIIFVNSCDKTLKGTTDELCKPFSKCDESRSNRTGSGLGLSIVKNIVNLHGFSFEAEADNGCFTAKILFK